MPFGNLLRQLRIAAGFSQEALAERARISLDTVGALERGRRQAPHRQTLDLIADGLGLADQQRAQLEAAAAASRTIGRPRTRAMDHAGAEVPSAPALAHNHNLPHAVNSFRDREHEQEELTKLIHARRLVTLHGAGGVGKTRLAIEVARAELSEEFEDGVWLIDLAAISDPDAIAGALAEVLGVREMPDEPIAETIVETLRERELLVVLDGCEHLLEGAARTAERLLRGCPSVRLLVTSREALQIDGELVYQVEPLALPPDGNRSRDPARLLEEIRSSPAVQLFLDRAEDADPHFFPAAAAKDPEAVVEICERLDGLPLTLELAAARVRDLTLREICRGLDSRFELLAHGKRTAQHRHRTLRAMFEWSYALLSDVEQRVFRRLAVFAGSWTIDAAVAVSSEPRDIAEDAVATLVSKSLIAVMHGAADVQRYRLLESLRAFARTLAEESGEDAATAKLHAEYYRERAQAAVAAWRSAQEQDPNSVFESLLVDMADVRAAIDWSVTQRQDVVLGAELTSVLADVWSECGLDAEGLRHLDAAWNALDVESGTGREPSLRIRGELAEPEGAAGVYHTRNQPAAPVWLASFTEERSYRSGETIFRAGDDARELLYILSGKVRLVELGVEVGAHELLGEIAFFSAGNRRTASALCATDVVVRSISREALLDLYDREPPFRAFLVQVFTRRLLADLEGVRERRRRAVARPPEMSG